jgi:hypothetical protein
MPTLRLLKGNRVKGNRIKQDAPRRGRGSSVSTERRHRYPAEEVWQVSEDKWQVVEACPPSPKAHDGFGEAGGGTSGTLTR